MTHSEKLRKTHRIVRFDMQVECVMERGILSIPKAHFKVFWEVKDDINILHHEKFLDELITQMDGYVSTLEHIT